MNERPMPAPRPRFSRKGHAYNTQKYKDFKNKIKWKIPKWHSEKQIYIKIAFVYALPQSMSNRKKSSLDGKYCEKHADVDNLAKTILDTMNNRTFIDDRQVVICVLEKFWGMEDMIKIEVEEF
ncbi:MAG: RusA family crossover junction endodeoxyribonuclease [Culicoidibacterales bacterium]